MKHDFEHRNYIIMPLKVFVFNKNKYFLEHYKILLNIKGFNKS